MRTNSIGFRTIVAGLVFAGLAIVPATSLAQRRNDPDRDRRHHPVRQLPPRGWQQNRNRNWHWDRNWDNRYHWEQGRPIRVWHPPTYRYPIVEYRRINPNWNDRYYYRSGTYYYDPGYTYRAANIDNEWLGIAGLAGGVSLLGALSGDRTLFFAGAAGELYSLYRFNEDLHSSDRARRLRATYFDRPYFWRDGVRYERVIVTRNGDRFYQFVRR